MTDVSVAELRTRAAARVRARRPGRRASTSRSTLAPDCPDTIVTDPQRLRQILKNLLANAFKFTEHGEVHVRIGLADDGWSPEMRVARRGVRPSWPSRSATPASASNEQQQQRIFEAFAQGDGTTARLYGGTGLGLSISRELVGLLGGEITVASTPGQGSTFTVYLPSIGHATVTTTPSPTGDDGAGTAARVRHSGCTVGRARRSHARSAPTQRTRRQPDRRRERARRRRRRPQSPRA